jgi:uncharacterized protein YbgA (DUF1722 family)/uncharacterized protein YbbK (DUF523 family)
MNAHEKPIVVTSACLETEACRYNGQRIPFDFLTELNDHVDLQPICPEVEIGLGTPRAPIRLVRGVGGPSLVQPSTGLDVTNSMAGFSKGFLSGRRVDGFILKNRSPSCGTNGVKIYDAIDTSSAHQHGPGVFAAEVLDRHPDAAIEDEGRLRNYRIREHFLTKLFALAALRRVETEGKMRALVAFHSRYKLTLMAYNQTAMRELGRTVANSGGLTFQEVIDTYRTGLARAFQRVPTVGAVVNTIEHAWGYVSDRLGAPERAYYRRQLDRFRAGRVPVSAVLAVLETSVARFGVDYLMGQAFFHPYPDELRSVADSGKGRAKARSTGRG